MQGTDILIHNVTHFSTTAGRDGLRKGPPWRYFVITQRSTFRPAVLTMAEARQSPRALRRRWRCTYVPDRPGVVLCDNQDGWFASSSNVPSRAGTTH